MKRIKAVVCVLAFSASLPAFAANDHHTQNTQVCAEGEICFAEDLLKEVVKESVETVGKHLIDKYMEKREADTAQKNNNTQQNTNNSNSNNSTTTTTQSNTTGSDSGNTTYTTRTGGNSGDSATTTSTTTTTNTTEDEEELTIID